MSELTETGGYMQMLEKAVANPDLDVDKLEKLLDMQERIIDKASEQAFNNAMNAAQSEMGPISADAVNPQTKSKYASYAQLDRVLRPIYTTHGFSLSFGTEDCPKPEEIRVICDVAHVDGHSRKRQIDMPADGKGAKGGDVMTKTHATGAGVTYGMRYLLKMIFNVAIGAEDTDGNTPAQTITEEQVADIEALLDEINNREGVVINMLKFAQVDEIEIIPSKRYNAVISSLEKIRADQ